MIRLLDRRGQRYALDSAVLKIGRALDNDIVLTDISISRYHIALQPMEDAVVVSNTGSDAGFYVNDQWVLDKMVVKSGDVIRIGYEEFIVEVQAPHKSDDFAFDVSPQASRTGSLDVNSRNKKMRKVLLALVAMMMVGVVLMPEDEDKTARGPASDGQKPTESLPSDSYLDLDVPRLGPQELTAEDLYKRGLRELSNNNQIRAIQFFQQSLVENPSLEKARSSLSDTEFILRNRINKLVVDSEKNYTDSRLTLSRSQAKQALDLISEQIPGFSFQVQQKQRTLASQRLPVLSREQIYLEMPCSQFALPCTDDENSCDPLEDGQKVCMRAVEVLKKSRLKLGEENVLK